MPYEDDSELDEIKRQVDQKLWRRGLVAAHFILWVIGCGVVGFADPPMVEIVAPVWFGLVVLHGLLVLMWEMRNHDIQAEVERRTQARGGEKLKRDRLYRLSDDGELVEVEESEDAAQYDIHR